MTLISRFINKLIKFKSEYLWQKKEKEKPKLVIGFWFVFLQHPSSCISVLCAQTLVILFNAVIADYRQRVSKDLHSEGGSLCQAQVIDRFAIHPCILIAFNVGVQGHSAQKLSVPIQYPGNFAAVHE